MATKFPDRPVSGEPLRATWGEQVLNYLRAITLRPSADLLVTTTTTGTTAALKRRTPATDAPEEVNYPFDIFASYNSDTAQMDVTFYPGTVNNQMPNNMFTTLHCSNSGFFYFVLNVSTDGKQVTNSTIEVSSAANTPSAPQLGAGPASFKVLIAVISDGVAHKLWGNANVNAYLIEVLREDKASPAPYTLPYQSYYNFMAKAT